MSEPATNVAVIEQARAPLVAGHKPTAIVPHSMEECYRLAKAVVAARMAPKGLDTTEQCMVAIMHGLEVGLTPMAALQRIAVVNGRPTIWGDGAIGLVRASGLLEAIEERVEGDGDKRVASCTVKRRGEQPATRTFSVADARTAGLWGKSGPWQNYPERMLQMRARAFALRDTFADVLGGLYVREELEDEVRAGMARDVTPARRVAPPPPAPAVEAGPVVEQKPAGPRVAPPPPAGTGRSSEPYGGPRRAPPPPPAPAAKSVVDEYRDALAACNTGEEFDNVADEYMTVMEAWTPEERRAAIPIHEEHLARVTKADREGGQ